MIDVVSLIGRWNYTHILQSSVIHRIAKNPINGGSVDVRRDLDLEKSQKPLSVIFTCIIDLNETQISKRIHTRIFIAKN